MVEEREEQIGKWDNTALSGRRSPAHGKGEPYVVRRSEQRRGGAARKEHDHHTRLQERKRQISSRNGTLIVEHAGNKAKKRTIRRRNAFPTDPEKQRPQKKGRRAAFVL